MMLETDVVDRFTEDKYPRLPRPLIEEVSCVELTYPELPSPVIEDVRIVVRPDVLI